MSDKAREIVLKHEKRLRDPRDCHAHNSAVMLSAVQEALAYNEQRIRELEEDLNLIYSEFDTEVDNPTKACTTIASLYHYSEEYRERINLLRVALASALTEINQFSGGYDDRQEVKA